MLLKPWMSTIFPEEAAAEEASSASTLSHTVHQPAKSRACPTLGVDFTVAQHDLVEVGIRSGTVEALPADAAHKTPTKEEEGGKMLLRLHQDLDGLGLGGVVWDCGKFLAQRLCFPDMIFLFRQLAVTSPSLRVIDLGSGTGVAGLSVLKLENLLNKEVESHRDVAQKIVIEVMLTDLPTMLPLLQKNLTLNFPQHATGSVCAYEWGEDPQNILGLNKVGVHVILCSDTLYDEKAFASFHKALCDLTDSVRTNVIGTRKDQNVNMRSPVVIMAYKKRHPGREIPAFQLLEQEFHVHVLGSMDNKWCAEETGIFICLLQRKEKRMRDAHTTGDQFKITPEAKIARVLAKAQTSRSPTIRNIPLPVIAEILSFLQIRDLSASMAVCSYFLEASKRQSVWMGNACASLRKPHIQSAIRLFAGEEVSTAPDSIVCFLCKTFGKLESDQQQKRNAVASSTSQSLSVKDLCHVLSVVGSPFGMYMHFQRVDDAVYVGAPSRECSGLEELASASPWEGALRPETARAKVFDGRGLLFRSYPVEGAIQIDVLSGDPSVAATLSIAATLRMNLSDILYKFEDTVSVHKLLNLPKAAFATGIPLTTIYTRETKALFLNNFFQTSGNISWVRNSCRNAISNVCKPSATIYESQKWIAELDTRSLCMIKSGHHSFAFHPVPNAGTMSAERPITHPVVFSSVYAMHGFETQFLRFFTTHRHPTMHGLVKSREDVAFSAFHRICEQIESPTYHRWVESIKITGDPNVPSGQVTWAANLDFPQNLRTLGRNEGDFLAIDLSGGLNLGFVTFEEIMEGAVSAHDALGQVNAIQNGWDPKWEPATLICYSATNFDKHAVIFHSEPHKVLLRYKKLGFSFDSLSTA